MGVYFPTLVAQLKAQQCDTRVAGAVSIRPRLVTNVTVLPQPSAACFLAAALLGETAAGDRGVVGEGPIAPASAVSAQQKELGPKVITVLVMDDRSANRARWRS